MNSAVAEPISGPTSFDTHHDDVIHDAKVDFYGRRLATASSDRTIRIFQINESETETLLSILSGHEGPVWQVAWAHPKFGSILASCSYDGSVIIWQEDKQQSTKTPAGTHSTWTKIKIHRVHESSVNSICFAPHSYGLQLACASSDGKVSVLKKDGDEWTHEIFDTHPAGCNSVSWAPSAIPSSILALDFNALEKQPVPIGPQRLATGGCDNIVKIWSLKEEGSENGDVPKWKIEASLEGHFDWIRDVCWRPNMGLTEGLLVSCGQDNRVLIWKFNEETKKWTSKSLSKEPFPDVLWRVSFSEYGHLLAVSCGDNTVTLWREKSENGEWESVGNVNETVTETAKIEEPLAVEPPPSAPAPEIDFTSSTSAYIKPMSPMIPLPSVHASQASPGYQQFNQAYDDYQHATTPTIPVVEPLSFNTEQVNTNQDQTYSSTYDGASQIYSAPYNNEYDNQEQTGFANTEQSFNYGYESQEQLKNDHGDQAISYENNDQINTNYDDQVSNFNTDYNDQNYYGSEQVYNSTYDSSYGTTHQAVDHYYQGQEQSNGAQEESYTEFNKDVGFIEESNQATLNENYPQDYSAVYQSGEIDPSYDEHGQNWNQNNEAVEYQTYENNYQPEALEQQPYQQFDEANYDPSQFDGQAQDYSQPSFTQDYYGISEYQTPQDPQHQPDGFEIQQQEYSYEPNQSTQETDYTLQYEGYAAPSESNQDYNGL